MKHIFQVISIIRPLNIAIAIISSLVVLRMVEESNIYSFILLCVVLICYISAGNILNDFLDINTDQINKPQRILVRYPINRYLIITLVIAFLVVGSFVASTLNPLSVYIALYFALPGILTYEFFFKRTPLLGNIIISMLVGSVFIYTEAVLTGQITITWKLMILAFSLNLIREIVKDIEDIKGDKSQNFQTLPMYIGIYKTIWVIRLISALFFIITILPYYLLISKYFFLLIFFTIHLPLLYINLGLRDNVSSKECAKFSNVLKLMIINGVLIILIFS